MFLKLRTIENLTQGQKTVKKPFFCLQVKNFRLNPCGEKTDCHLWRNCLISRKIKINGSFWKLRTVRNPRERMKIIGISNESFFTSALLLIEILKDEISVLGMEKYKSMVEMIEIYECFWTFRTIIFLI